VFEEPLLNNGKRYTHTDTQIDGKDVVTMGSVVLTYTPSVIKIDSGIQKLIREDLRTHRQYGDLISVLLIFRIRK
jgi:hypothetical protein